MINWDGYNSWTFLWDSKVATPDQNHYIPPHWEIHKVKPLSPVFQNKISNMNTS